MVVPILIHFLSFLPYLLILIAISILIGNVILQLSNTRKYDKLSLPLGILLIVSFYAIYIAHFKTVFLLVTPFYFIYLWVYRRSKLDFKQLILRSWNQFRNIVIPLIVFYSFNYLILLKTSLFPYFDIARDDFYYAQISNFITDNHLETMRLGWYNHVKDLGISQYHFFELYLNSVISNLFGLKGVESYTFLISAIGQTIFFSGLLFLYNQVSKIKMDSFIWISIIILVIVSPTVKFSFAFVPIILCIEGLKNDSSLLVAFSAALLLALNPLFLVLILPLFVLYISFKGLNYFRRHLILAGALLMVYVLFILIHQIFSGQIQNLNTGLFSPTDFYEYYADASHYKTLVHYWYKHLIKIFSTNPLLIPIIVIAIVYLRVKKLEFKYQYEVKVILFGGLLLSVLGSGLLHFMNESAQIFQFAYRVFIFISIPILLFNLSTVKNILIRTTILVFLVSTVFIQQKDFDIINVNDDRLGSYSKNFIDEVSSLVGGSEKPAVLRFLNNSHYKNTEEFNPYNSFNGYYLGFNYDTYYLHTFNMKDVPYRASLHNYYNFNRNKILPQVYDYNYFEQCKALNDEESLDQFLLDHENVNFILIEKDAVLPSNLKKYIGITITDSKSKEQFIKIIR